MISTRRLVHHPLFHLHYTSNACSEPRRCVQCRHGSDDWLGIAAWTIPRLVECYGFCVVEPGSASIVTSTSAPVSVLQGTRISRYNSSPACTAISAFAGCPGMIGGMIFWTVPA